MDSAGLINQISFEVGRGVANLSLRRPDKRNAISGPMWEAIIYHLEAARDREDIRMLVIRGEGGTFSAGADLGEVVDAEGILLPNFYDLVVRSLAAVADFPVPSVAIIGGHCMGGGCSLALACDFRFAYPSAVFSIPAVRHGILYDDASLARLHSLMGPGQAARLMYTAARVSATQAERLGLIDECIDDPERAVEEMLASVMQGRRSTISATKSVLRALDR